MTRDCSLNYKKKYKFRACCIQKLFFSDFCFGIQNNVCTQYVLKWYFSCNSKNNLSSKSGSTDSKMRASDTDLPVHELKSIFGALLLFSCTIFPKIFNKGSNYKVLNLKKGPVKMVAHSNLRIILQKGFQPILVLICIKKILLFDKHKSKSLLDSLLKSPALFFLSKTFILPRLHGGKAVFSKKVIWKNQV